MDPPREKASSDCHENDFKNVSTNGVHDDELTEMDFGQEKTANGNGVAEETQHQVKFITLDDFVKSSADDEQQQQEVNLNEEESDNKENDEERKVKGETSEDKKIVKENCEEYLAQVSEAEKRLNSVEIQEGALPNGYTMDKKDSEHKESAPMQDEKNGGTTGTEKLENTPATNGIGADVLVLIGHMNNLKNDRITPIPTIPNDSKKETRTGTAPAQKKGVVNKKPVEPKQDQQAKSVSRKSEAVRESTKRPQSAAVSKRVSTPSASTTRLTSAKLESATKKSGTTSDRVKNIFESSPLAKGASLDLKDLAKSAPSHLLRPSSTLCRPTTSSLSKTLGSFAGSPRDTPTSARQAKTSKSVTSSKTTSVQSSRGLKMGDSQGGSGEKATLKDQFAAFSRFGDAASDGKQITLSNCDKWMKQAHVIDGKKITTTDTSILFKKLFKTAKKIGFEDFKKYAEELATSKKQDPKEVIEKLTNSGAPGISGTKAVSSGVVDRLTDTSKYTGSHKERFDSAGKGRGIEGRRNVQDDSGYVAAFKEKRDDEKKKSEATSSSPTPAK